MFHKHCLLNARRSWFLTNIDFIVCSIRKTLENRSNMEDDRIALLEEQLQQARLIAEETDKKYDEVKQKIRQALLPVTWV